MNQHTVLPVLDIGIKYTVLLFCSYYVFMRCLFDKPEVKKYFSAMVFASLMGIALIWIKGMIMPLHVILMLLYLVETNHYLFGQEMQINIVLSALSYALSQAIFLVIGFVGSVAMVLLYWDDEKGEENSIYDFLNDIPIHIISYTIMIAGLFCTVFLIMRGKRIRKGLMKIVNIGAGGTGIIILMILLTCTMGFGLPDNTLFLEIIRTSVFIVAMMMCILLTAWIKNEISQVYYKMVLGKSLALTESEIAEKDGIIEELLKDNERMADIIRKDENLIVKTVSSIRAFSNGMEHVSVDTSEITNCARQLEEIYSERGVSLSEYESHGHRITETGVKAVDNVLLYMADRAENSGVDFVVDVETDIEKMLGSVVDSREFNTLLADLAENAIISAKKHLPGSVAVNFIDKGGSCSVEVLDSGEKFDVDVLKTMGKKRITTHTDEGGSGIGLMTLFHIIRRNSASLTIEEYPDGLKYSKAVRVSFDKKSRCTIDTYRADELKKVLRFNRFHIVSESPLPE